MLAESITVTRFFLDGASTLTRDVSDLSQFGVTLRDIHTSLLDIFHSLASFLTLTYQLQGATWPRLPQIASVSVM